ncbi:MAG: hypothetical protein JNM43_13620 [Planctomycetaceae bacterium]|nr:hypothetical protein [Planctomycetaceae bacterium]
MSRAIAEESRFSTDYQFAATFPGVVTGRPNGEMNRTEMHRLMNERLAQDPDLRQALHDHPRAVYAVAVEECFGIHRSLFFVQISHVEVISEDVSTLGVVMTACHLACVAPRLSTGAEQNDSQCHICSHRGLSCQPPAKPSSTPASRSDLRKWIQNRVESDPGFREELTVSPSSAWSRVSAELRIPQSHPLSRIQTLRVFVESAETIGFILEFPDVQGQAI